MDGTENGKTHVYCRFYLRLQIRTYDSRLFAKIVVIIETKLRDQSY